MKLTVGAKEFLASLNAVHKAVPGRETIPILNNVLLRADGEAITCTGTDLDVIVSASLPVSGEAGETTVRADMLRGIVQSAGDETLSLEMDGGKLNVSSGRRNYSLETLPVEDFPAVSEPKFSHEFEADISSLAGPLRYAASTETVRYYLNGVYLHEQDGKLRGVATDGHQLAYRETALPEAASGMPGIIVPSGAIGIFPQGLSTVRVNDRQIRVENGGVTVTSKLIDGSFPDYSRLLPDHPSKALVNREAFIHAAQSLALVTTDRAGLVKLSFSDSALEMEARGDARGRGVETLDCEIKGGGVSLGMVSRYLVAALSGLDCELVHVGMTDPGTPLSFTDPDDDSRYALVMPYRINF